MEVEYTLTSDGELYHWGIKGMKWGQRRYQNKDGSLTPAGRKRYAAEIDSLKARERSVKGRERAKVRQDKINAKKAELDEREKALDGGMQKSIKKRHDGKRGNENAPEQKRHIKDISDDELRTMTARLQAEKNYLDLRRQVSAMTPQKVSKGRQFVDTFVDAAIPKLAKSSADVIGDYINTQMRDALGLNKKDAKSIYDMAKQEAELWKNRNEAAKNRKEYEDRKSGKSTEPDKYEQAKRDADYYSNLNKATQQRKHYERTKEEAIEDDINSRMNNIDEKNAKARKDREAAEKAEREKVHEGVVEGEGTRRRYNDTKERHKPDPIIIDMETDFNDRMVTDLAVKGQDWLDRYYG